MRTLLRGYWGPPGAGWIAVGLLAIGGLALLAGPRVAIVGTAAVAAIWQILLVAVRSPGVTGAAFVRGMGSHVVAWLGSIRARRILPTGEPFRRGLAAAAAGVAWSVLLAPVLWRVAHGPVTGFEFSDWNHHLRLVPRFEIWPLVVPIPHFLFEAGTASVQAAFGRSLETSGVIVATVAVGATGAALAWFFQRPWQEPHQRPSPGLGAIWSVAFALCELPQFLFFGRTALRGDLVNNSLHQWNTPSTVTAESLQVLVFAGAVTALTVRTTKARTVRWLPLIVVLAMIAKPSVPLVLAAAVVPWLWRSQAERWAWRRGLLAIVVPVVVVAIVQFFIGAVWWEPDAPSSLGLRFGGSLRDLDPWGPGLGVLVLPVLALVTGGRELVRHDATRLAAWCLVAGLVATGTIVETGLRAADANVARTAFGGYWLLYLCLARWVLELWRRRSNWDRWSVRRRLGAALLVVYAALSLASGVGLYLEQIGAITFTGARG